jgi:NADPH:quinone reductase-like Zn-dependent oxidoreductase
VQSKTFPYCSDKPDAQILLHMAQVVKAGKLKIPLGGKLPLKDAEKGHASVAKGGIGKVLLVVNEN